MKISIIGLGYVGLVTAGCLAEKGHEIIGYDINNEKINMLKEGIIPIFEQGLEELLSNNKSKLYYTTNKEETYSNSDIIFICVGTPSNEDGTTNLEYMYKTIEDIIKYVKKDILVVIKSTVPIGTTKKVKDYINTNVDNKNKIDFAFNPEFLSQGTAVKDALEPQRIIIGVDNENSKIKLQKIYSDFSKSVILFTDINSAEMIKYASNDFLALKISYINEIANLCEILDANIEDVKRGIGLDKRIGDKFLNPGIGYGGSCFPKDTKSLYMQAKINNYELKTVKATIEVNNYQRKRLIDKLKKYYPSIKGVNIAILGLTFKPKTNDLRESLALENIKNLDGANIKIFDPLIKEIRLENSKNVKCLDTIDETIKNADVCMIFTECEEIKNYDINKYQKLMKNPIILDGRNCYSCNAFRKTNITYESIGRKTINER